MREAGDPLVKAMGGGRGKNMMTSYRNRKYSRVSPVDPGRTSEENQTFSNESVSSTVGHQEGNS